MAKLLKILLYVVGGIILLVVVLLVAILIFVDPNDYKDDITAVVQQQTGRELILSGDLSLSVFPWLGVSLGEAQLSNAEGFGDASFASVDKINIKVKLLPLLKKRVEMQTIQLYGLQMHLVTLADGHTNWEDLGASAADEEKSTRSLAPSAAPNKAALPLAALAIGGLDIEDARIEWDDRQAGQHILVDHLNVSTGAVTLYEPVDLQLAMDLTLQQPVLNSHVEFAGRLSYNLDTQQYRIDGMKLDVDASGEPLPVSPLVASLSADVQADLVKQQVMINALHLKALNLAMQGQAEIQQLQSSPSAHVKLAIDGFSPRELLSTLALPIPETADPEVLRNAQVATELDGSADAINVHKLALVLDKTTVTGSASVTDYQHPAIEFDVLVDDIDVDRYLPPPSEAETPPPTPGTAAAGATQLPLDMLRQLNVSGQIKAGKFKVAKARLSDVVLGIKAAGGQIRLHPVQADLYSGKYSGNILLDVRKDTPRLSLNEKLTSVAIGPLLKDVMEDDLVTGTANLSAILTASGTEPDSIVQTLNGSGAFVFRDGAVKGVNLGQLIREANARLKKQPPPAKTTNQTDFAEMTGSVDIKQGVVSNQDLLAKTPLLRISGNGKVDLPKQKIDYRVNASVVNTAKGQAGADLADLNSVTIPIKVSGSFAEPKFSLDLKPVLEAKAKAEVEKQKQEIEKEVDKKVEEQKQDVKEKLKDKLKKLF